MRSDKLQDVTHSHASMHVKQTPPRAWKQQCVSGPHQTVKQKHHVMRCSNTGEVGKRVCIYSPLFSYL